MNIPLPSSVTEVTHPIEVILNRFDDDSFGRYNFNKDFVKLCATSFGGFFAALNLLVPKKTLDMYAGGCVSCIYYGGSFFVNRSRVSARDIYLAFSAIVRAYEFGVQLDQKFFRSYVAEQRGNMIEDWRRFIPYPCRLGYVDPVLGSALTATWDGGVFLVDGSCGPISLLMALFFADVHADSSHSREPVIELSGYSGSTVDYVRNNIMIKSAHIPNPSLSKVPSDINGYVVGECPCKVCAFGDFISQKYCLSQYMKSCWFSLLCGVTHHTNTTYFSVSLDYYHQLGIISELMNKPKTFTELMNMPNSSVTGVMAAVGEIPGSMPVDGLEIRGDKYLLGKDFSYRFLDLTVKGAVDSVPNIMDEDFCLYVDRDDDSVKRVLASYRPPVKIYIKNILPKSLYPFVKYVKLKRQDGYDVYVKNMPNAPLYGGHQAKLRVPISPVVIGALFLANVLGEKKVLFNCAKSGASSDMFKYDLPKGRKNGVEDDRATLQRELEEE